MKSRADMVHASRLAAHVVVRTATMAGRIDELAQSTRKLSLESTETAHGVLAAMRRIRRLPIGRSSDLWSSEHLVSPDGNFPIRRQAPARNGDLESNVNSPISVAGLSAVTERVCSAIGDIVAHTTRAALAVPSWLSIYKMGRASRGSLNGRSTDLQQRFPSNNTFVNTHSRSASLHTDYLGVRVSGAMSPAGRVRAQPAADISSSGFEPMRLNRYNTHRWGETDFIPLTEAIAQGVERFRSLSVHRDRLTTREACARESGRMPTTQRSASDAFDTAYARSKASLAANVESATRHTARLRSAFYVKGDALHENGLSSDREWRINRQRRTSVEAWDLANRSARDHRRPSGYSGGGANDYLAGGERSASGYRAESVPLIVNYSPTVTLSDAPPGEMERRLVEAIGRHGSDLVRVLNQEMEKRRRAGF